MNKQNWGSAMVKNMSKKSNLLDEELQMQILRITSPNSYLAMMYMADVC